MADKRRMLQQQLIGVQSTRAKNITKKRLLEKESFEEHKAFQIECSHYIFSQSQKYRVECELENRISMQNRQTAELRRELNRCGK